MIFTYLRCLEIELANPNQKFTYWLEEKLRIEFQRFWMMALCKYPNYFQDLPAGTKLIKKIAEDIFEETDSEWTEASFRQFVNMDTKKFRELLLKWYLTNTVIFDRYCKEWEEEEAESNEKKPEESNDAARKERLKLLATIL